MTNSVLISFQILGAILFSVVAVNCVWWLWKHLWLPRKGQGDRLVDRYGRDSWVLITGASDGLGKAFARDFAKYGFNLVLVSRTQSKLDRLQEELQARGVQVRTLAADLSDSSGEVPRRIKDVVQGLDLSIVVNCVGVTIHRRYCDVPAESVRHLLSVNVNTTATVTHALLPVLLEHANNTGQRCALLNVGSIVGRFHWPGTQLYGACKAFIDHLTVPLAYEYKEQLDVLSFQPTVMATAMAAGTEPAAITITPEMASHAALSHLGRFSASHGHWRHALLAAVFSILPRRMRNRIYLTKALEMGDVELAQGG